MWKVRNAEQEVLLLLLNGLETLFQVRELGVGASRFGHQRRGIFAFGPRLTDALGELVAVSLELLGTGLHTLALLLDRLEGCDIENERSHRESPCHGVDVAAKELQIKHAYFFFFIWPSRLRKYASLSATFASRPRSVGSYHFTGGMPSGK